MVDIPLVIAQSDFQRELSLVEERVAFSQAWVQFAYPSPIPAFRAEHRFLFMERIFLCAFQAWEQFLEETFTLYYLGERSPSGVALTAKYPTTNREHAMFTMLQGKSYCEWSPVDNVLRLNNLIFLSSDQTCFSKLKLIRSKLDEIADIRNAISHRSDSSWIKFKNIARNKLSTGTLPHDLSVGKFLASPVPMSSPPAMFLDSYLEILRDGASFVVPS